MMDLSFSAFFVIGLLGGIHCLGMCGGIVTLFQWGQAPLISKQTLASATHHANYTKIIPIKSMESDPIEKKMQLLLQLSYHLGRVTTYTVLGILAGSLSGGLALIHPFASSLQHLLLIAINLLLIGAGLYLSGFWHGFAKFEEAGRWLWQRVQPYARHVIPMNTIPRALSAGALWGLLPCGMLYTALMAALLTGNAWRGGLLMLAFGLGTLPMLLMTGRLAQYLRQHQWQTQWRWLGGMLIILFGVLGLVRLTPLGNQIHHVLGQLPGPLQSLSTLCIPYQSDQP